MSWHAEAEADARSQWPLDGTVGQAGRDPARVTLLRAATRNAPQPLDGATETFTGAWRYLPVPYSPSTSFSSLSILIFHSAASFVPDPAEFLCRLVPVIVPVKLWIRPPLCTNYSKIDPWWALRRIRERSSIHAWPLSRPSKEMWILSVGLGIRSRWTHAPFFFIAVLISSQWGLLFCIALHLSCKMLHCSGTSVTLYHLGFRVISHHLSPEVLWTQGLLISTYQRKFSVAHLLTAVWVLTLSSFPLLHKILKPLEHHLFH